MKRCGGKLPVWDFDCPEAKVDTQAAAILLWAVKEIQAMGSSASKIDAFVKLMASYGIILELCRTGIVALERGNNTLFNK